MTSSAPVPSASSTSAAPGPTTRPRAGAARRRRPDLRHERALLRSGARLVAGMDEVGRGALAGPVSVGVVVVDLSTGPCPPGLTDSKLLTAAAREAMSPLARDWALAWAVGHAGPAEIDAHGIVAALRLAGRRALAQVRRTLGEVDAVLLDGKHDWLSRPREVDLFEAFELDPDGAGELADPAVRTLVKADLQCSSVAAASVLAKCERDELMTGLARQHPAYGWEQNKGYGAPGHVAALRAQGPSPLHRRSWRLPAQEQAPVPVEAGTAPVEAPLAPVRAVEPGGPDGPGEPGAEPSTGSGPAPQAATFEAVPRAS